MITFLFSLIFLSLVFGGIFAHRYFSKSMINTVDLVVSIILFDNAIIFGFFIYLLS